MKKDPRAKNQAPEKNQTPRSNWCFAGLELFWILVLGAWCFSSAAQSYGPLQYKVTTLMFSPSNALGSNLVAGTNVVLTKDSQGRTVINSAASGGGGSGSIVGATNVGNNGVGAIIGTNGQRIEVRTFIGTGLATTSTNATNLTISVPTTRVDNLDGATNGLTTRASNLEGGTNGLRTDVLNLQGATNGLDSKLTTTSNSIRTDLANLQGATNGLTTRASNLEGGTNGLRTDVLNLQGATNGLTTRASNLEGGTNGLRTDVLNLQGATNGLTTRASNLEGGTNGLRTDVLNLQGATNGLTTRASNLEGGTNGLRTDVLNLQGATNGLDSKLTTTSNGLYSTETTRNAAVSNALVTQVVGRIAIQAGAGNANTFTNPTVAGNIDVENAVSFSGSYALEAPNPGQLWIGTDFTSVVMNIGDDNTVVFTSSAMYPYTDGAVNNGLDGNRWGKLCSIDIFVSRVLVMSNITASRVAVFNGTKQLTNEQSSLLYNISYTGALTNAPWTNSYQPASPILTNLAGTGALTNAPWTNSYQTASPTLTNLAGTGAVTNRGGTLWLPVQSAHLPSTNAAMIDGGWRNWELVFARTNPVGSNVSISASWQFPLPADYVSNSMTFRVLSTLLSTNGPNTSNVIFRASVVAATPGGSTDVRVTALGSTVSGTNSWTQSVSNTNKVQAVTINMAGNTGSAIAGDWIYLQLDRDNVNDTFVGASAVVGLSLEYTRQ
jgi:hypothetical protein